MVKVAGGPKLRSEFMSEPALTADLLTYAEAAEATGFSRNYIANLVSQGTLHSQKVEGRHLKYLLKEEVEWLQRRRSGINEPNPLADGAQMTAAVPGADVSMIDAALHEYIVPAEAATEALPGVGVAFALLVLGLLFAFMMQRQPNKEQLERLKQAPELRPLKQAIRRLARELDAA
jgi:excisionase family DNA binding protein